MINTSFSRSLRGRFVGAVSCLITIINCGIIGYGQQCPTINNHGWPKNKVVKVQLDPNLQQQQRDQIQLAMSRWTTANTTDNGSGVSFRLVQSGETPDLTFRNVTSGQTDPVKASVQLNADGSVSSATVSWNLNATIPGTSNPAYDPNLPVPEGAFSNGYDTIFLKDALHEIGHTMGLGEPPGDDNPCVNQVPGNSVMNGACGTNDTGAGGFGTGSTVVTSCDNLSVFSQERYNPPPSSSDDKDQDGFAIAAGDCNDDPADSYATSTYPGAPTMCMAADFNCNNIDDRSEPTPEACGSPVLIDVLGNGFNLTNAAGGTLFNLTGVGAMRWSWVAPGSDDAWLVFDRDGDNSITSGAELFGCVTPQPLTSNPHGFLALMEYDKPDSGGNGDGAIDHSDAVYSSLRLWQDVNHNGVSDPGELYTLPSLGLARIDLDYRESRRTDGHGNVFRYRAKVYSTNGQHLGRWAYDVFLRTGQ